MSKKQIFSKIVLFAALFSSISGYIRSEDIKKSTKPKLQRIEPKKKDVGLIVDHVGSEGKFEKICDVLKEFSKPLAVILIVIGLNYNHYNVQNEIKDLQKSINDLNENNRNLESEILNCRYDIKHEILVKNSEISEANLLLLSKIKNLDKFIVLLSHLSNKMITSINGLFSKSKNINRLDHIIGLCFNRHQNFFCDDLFDDFFLKTTDDKLQNEYAGFLYFSLMIMFYQCKTHVGGTSSIEIFSDETKKKIDGFINSNNNLHIEKIESDEKSITITTKNIPNRTTLKIFLTSDKTMPFKIEFK